MVTLTSSMHWAEAYLRSADRGVLAALVRGDELFMLTLTTDGLDQQVMEAYKLIRPGKPVEGIEEVHQTEEGRVFFFFAWLDSMETSDDNEEMREALKDARRNLDAYTNPAERLEKAAELIRWSVIASSGDFSFSED